MSYVRQIGLSASEDRLETLIEERVHPGADKDAIDGRIWDLFGETWAVMFTDLAGFSRAVAEFGIIHFLQVIHESQKVLVPCIDRHDGILLKIEADSLLVIFRNVAKAIDCAVSMHGALQAYNVDRSEAEKILLCIGLGYGRMLRIGDQDVFGAEVNAASKLGEDIAEAWEVLVTDSVRNAAQGIPGLRFEPIPEVPPGAKAAFRLLSGESPIKRT
ncbi:MAG: adenylate/guanylate cyclase domain-containing protein [Planctomycetota bacterium]